MTIPVGPEISVSLPALAAFGVFVGYVAGMFGVGGGFLLTPMLIHVFGIPPTIAVGSSLSQTCGTSVASFLKYRRLKRGEPRLDLVMMGGSLIGMDAGTRLLLWLNQRAPMRLPSGRYVPAVDVVVDALFLVVLSLVAVTMFRDAWQSQGRPSRGDRTVPGPLVTRVRIPPYVDLPDVGLRQVSIPLLGYLGFTLGALSGMMGLGGGVMLTPVLLYGFGISARNAAGTGILLLFATVALGTVTQALHGNVDLRLVMAILVGSSLGSQLGAITTHRLPNRWLRMLFAVLVAVTVVMIAQNLLALLRGTTG